MFKDGNNNGGTCPFLAFCPNCDVEPLFWESCQVWTLYQLPVRTVGQRQRPYQLNYRGVTLYYSFEYVPSKLYPGGELKSITFSFRAPSSKRSTTGYGKVITKESYAPVAQQPIPRGADIPESVVVATLDRIFIKYLWPKILASQPNLWNADQPFALLAPIAFDHLCQLEGFAPSTKAVKLQALDTLLKLFGALLISEVTPERCAPIMMDAKITKAAFFECVRVMRALFESQFAQIVEDKKAWTHYAPHGFRRKYSVAAATRRVFLHQPLTAWQCSVILDRCFENITDPLYGAWYFAAAVLLLTAMDLTEVCALHGYSIAPIGKKEDGFAISVTEVIKTIGEAKTLTADGKRRKRGRQHKPEQLDPASPQTRKLPFCHILGEMWALLSKTRKIGPDDYILHDPRNTARNLSPEEFSHWLDNTFSDIVQLSAEFKLADKSIRATYHVEDFIAASADMIYNKSSIPEEGIRRLLGLRPLHTDAKNYIDFQDDSALRMFNRCINEWCSTHILDYSGGHQHV